MKHSKTQKIVLQALVAGATLKSHRYLDGRKITQLHPLDGPAQTVRWTTVQALIERGLIDSNKKFPAAAYLLTEKGRQVAESLADSAIKPLSAKNF